MPVSLRPAPALLCLGLLATPPALAQTPAAPAAETPALPPAGQESLAKGSVFRALGPEVKGPAGSTVALLVNVLVDAEGTPRAAVLDYGGFLGVGRRRVAVAWPTLRFGPQGIQLLLGRDQLKAFPEYRDGEEVVMATLPAAAPETAPAAGPAPGAETPAAPPPAPSPPAAPADAPAAAAPPQPPIPPSTAQPVSPPAAPPVAAPPVTVPPLTAPPLLAPSPPDSPAPAAPASPG